MIRKTVLLGLLMALGFGPLAAQQSTGETNGARETIESSLAVISIKGNNGGLVIKLRLPLIEMDGERMIWKFSDGNSHLTITVIDEDSTQWRLEYKGRPYQSDIASSGDSLTMADTNAGSTLRFAKDTSLAGMTMSAPTAYVVLKDSYVYFAN